MPTAMPTGQVRPKNRPRRRRPAGTSRQNDGWPDPAVTDPPPWRPAPGPTVPEPSLPEASFIARYIKQTGAPPSPAVINARRLRRDLRRVYPRAAASESPAPRGAVALVYTPDPAVADRGSQRCVRIICAANGAVQCQVDIDGATREAHWPNAARLPDAFMREALAEMRHRVFPRRAARTARQTGAAAAALS